MRALQLPQLLAIFKILLHTQTHTHLSEISPQHQVTMRFRLIGQERPKIDLNMVNFTDQTETHRMVGIHSRTHVTDRAMLMAKLPRQATVIDNR